MASIVVFRERAFVKTGENIITEDYTLSVPTKCTLAVSAVSQGDSYARIFEVYSDGVLKFTRTVMNSFEEQVNLGFLEGGRHTVGIKLATYTGGWVVSGTIIPDYTDAPLITPPLVSEEPISVEPSAQISGPMVVSPPKSDAPIPDEGQPTSSWDFLRIPQTWRIPTQSEIDAKNRDTNRLKAIAETGIKPIAHIEAIPTMDWAQSSSIPLSVQAVNDRLKDIPTGYLPMLDVPSGVLGSPEYGPTEMPYLTGPFSAHKDNYGRDVLSFGESFSMEPNMILLGMGLAALAAAAFFKRNEIAKYLKR